MPQPRRALPTRAAATVAAGIASAAVLAGALGVTTSAAAAPSDPASEIITLTNEARGDAGAAPLLHSDDLQATAQAWAQHLADGAAFQHNPSIGEQLPSGWSTWGENIAMGTGAAPSSMHAMWMDSPGHYRNLTNADFNVMGVGYATAADGTVYGVEVFGRYADPASVGGEPVQTVAPPVDDVADPEPTPSEQPSDPPAAEPPPVEPAAEVTATAVAPVTSSTPAAATSPATTAAAQSAAELAGESDPRTVPALPLVIGAVLAGGVSVAAFAASRRRRDS